MQSRLVEMARLHCETYIFKAILEEFKDSVAAGDLESKVADHLKLLMRIKAVKMILRNPKPLFGCGAFKSSQI